MSCWHTSDYTKIMGKIFFHIAPPYFLLLNIIVGIIFYWNRNIVFRHYGDYVPLSNKMTYNCKYGVSSCAHIPTYTSTQRLWRSLEPNYLCSSIPCGRAAYPVETTSSRDGQAFAQRAHSWDRCDELPCKWMSGNEQKCYCASKLAEAKVFKETHVHKKHISSVWKCGLPQTHTGHELCVLHWAGVDCTGVLNCVGVGLRWTEVKYNVLKWPAL